MDCIHISDIHAYGYTGALPEEQVLGQWFWVDLTLWLDLVPSGTSDTLTDTLDYCDVIESVQQIVKTQRLVLLERLTTVIAEMMLATNPQVQQVRVQLTKPHPPIPEFSGKVMIDITRQR
jgi:7,8-dihydroneopterin aldolase/epimerase/oxygenase